MTDEVVRKSVHAARVAGHITEERESQIVDAIVSGRVTRHILGGDDKSLRLEVYALDEEAFIGFGSPEISRDESDKSEMVIRATSPVYTGSSLDNKIAEIVTRRMRYPKVI